MPDIAWHLFTWQAFATLTTGALAVGGAVWVALRQMAITGRQADTQERQARIQERQVGLQERTLALQLFDKRLEIYEITAAFLDEAVASKGAPAATSILSLGNATGKSRFLFRPQVHEAMAEIFLKGEEWDLVRKRIEGATTPAPADIQLNNDLGSWFFARLGTITDVFKPEMMLAEVSRPIGGGPHSEV